MRKQLERVNCRKYDPVGFGIGQPEPDTNAFGNGDVNLEVQGSQSGT
jgi:hypothetical protein